MTKTEYNKAYYAANKERLKANSRAWWHANRDRLLQYDKDRYPKRREQTLARLKEEYRKNPERQRARNKIYWAKNKDRLSLVSRRWRQKNADWKRRYNAEYTRSNPNKVRIWSKKWANKNPGKIKAYDVNRRARELGSVINAEAVKQFFAWIKNQDYVTCTYCGCYITGKSVHIDHIVPLSRGGTHDPHNFAVSCPHCNQSKSDFLLSEWPKCPEKFKNIVVN